MEMLVVNNHIRSWRSSKHWNENMLSQLKVNIKILLGWELSARRQIRSAWQLKTENSLTQIRMSWNITLGEKQQQTNQQKRREEGQKPKLREGDM